MMFVDGSNLSGVASHLEVNFSDYEALFGYLFHSCFEQWSKSFSPGANPTAQYVRVYWYVIGSCDHWDLDNPQTLSKLRDRFDRAADLSAIWSERAAAASGSAGTAADAAWELYLRHTRDWYNETLNIVEGMSRFYHSVESSTDFIELRRSGHWKLDVLRHRREEKGVDTAFAVDMATMTAAYDLALLISGDADGIPSIEYAKSAGKQVAVVEFLKGEPPEERGKNMSAKLKLAADFVTPIYEQDLLNEGIARRREIDGRGRSVST